MAKHAVLAIAALVCAAAAWDAPLHGLAEAAEYAEGEDYDSIDSHEVYRIADALGGPLIQGTQQCPNRF